MRGTPDLVVTMDAPYPLPAAGEDVYRNFVVRIPTTRARFVQAIELRPATTRGIHHARILVDRSGSARRLADADPVPGYDDRHVDRARPPDGHFLGWAPGTVPNEVADYLAWRLEPGADLVLKAHLVPRGEPTPVQVSVGFFFADAAPTAMPAVVQLGIPDHRHSRGSVRPRRGRQVSTALPTWICWPSIRTRTFSPGRWKPMRSCRRAPAGR